MLKQVLAFGILAGISTLASAERRPASADRSAASAERRSAAPAQRRSAAPTVRRSASTEVVRFSGLPTSFTQQTTYVERGVTVTSSGGAFWAFPTAGQLHLDEPNFFEVPAGNGSYDFTFEDGLFNLLSLDVSWAESSFAASILGYGSDGAQIGSPYVLSNILGTVNFGSTFEDVFSIRITSLSGHFSIDNFTVSAAAPDAVPEPGTWAMMLLGFGAVGHALRRRRQTRVVQPQAVSWT
jgi:hypothetical protein